MPIFEVELHDGRKYHVEADTQPSETEVMQALGGQFQNLKGTFIGRGQSTEPPNLQQMGAAALPSTMIKKGTEAGANYLLSKATGGFAPDVEIPTVRLPPIPLSPQTGPAMLGTFQAGVERGLGNLLAGFIQPEQLPLLAASPYKPIQALFGLGAAEQTPGSIRRLIAARTPQERGEAGTEVGANLLMAGGIGRELVREPRIPNQPIGPETGQTVHPQTEAGLGSVRDVVGRIAENPQSRLSPYAAELLARRGQSSVMEQPVGLTPEQSNFQQGRIGINPAHTKEDMVVLHEVTHALTDKASPEVKAQLNDLFNEVKGQAGEEQLHGLTRPEEFLTEALTNPSFQQWLRFQRVEGRSLADRTIDLMYSLAGRARMKGSRLAQMEPLMERALEPNEPLEIYRQRPEVGPERQLIDPVARAEARRTAALEKQRLALEPRTFPREGMPFVSKEKGQGPVSGQILQSGAPIKPEDLRPAVRISGRIVPGNVGDIHADILKRNGVSPEEIPHSDIRRGFVDQNGEWHDRQSAAAILGKGTANAGGADSMDLPGAATAQLLRSSGFNEKEISEAIRELRTSDVSKETPSGDLQKVGEEVRTGAETQGVTREEEKGQRLESGAPRPGEEAPQKWKGKAVAGGTQIVTKRDKPLIQLLDQYGVPRQAKGGKHFDEVSVMDVHAQDMAAKYEQVKTMHRDRVKRLAGEELSQENQVWQAINRSYAELSARRGELLHEDVGKELEVYRRDLEDQIEVQRKKGTSAQPGSIGEMERRLLNVKNLQGGERLESGAPIRDILQKLDNDRATLFKMLSPGYRKISDQVFSKRDAVDNAPLITANRAENHLDQTAKKDFKGKEIESADNAVVAVLVSHGNQAALRNFATLVAGKDKTAEASVKFAQANWTKLQNLVNQVKAIDAQNVAMAKANGVDIPTIEDYLKQSYKTEGQGLFFGRRGGAGIGLGSKLPRKYPNIFEAIADGREPISLSAKALVGKRTAEIQREINIKQWLDVFRKVVDPTTKEPIITDLKRMGPNRPPATKEGYGRVEGLDVGIHKGYEPLFTTAVAKSVAEGSRTLQALLQTEGGIKHGTLAFDFYHLFRVSMLGGRAGLGVRGLPFGKMGKRGVSLLEFSEKDLADAVKQGDAPPEALTYQNERVNTPQGNFTRREVGSLGIKAGLNIGRHSEALYTSFVRDFPILKQTIGNLNRYIFDTLSRGVAYEGFQIEFERLANANPKMPVEQVARNVARDINFRLGNIGRQGFIKSKTMRDITSLLFLAPRWVESMGQSEIRAVGQVVKALGTASPMKVGTLGKSTATLVGTFFIATQALNYLINGQFTWDNKNNKGHELDLWIPPLREGDKGFHVSPFSVPMELTHDLLRYTREGQSVPDALARIAENKLSPLAQGASTFLSGRDYKGEEVPRISGSLGAALNPLPLPARQAIQSAKQKSIAPFERQSFSLLGIKAEPETIYEQRSREAEGKDIIKRAVESGVQRQQKLMKSPAERLLAETASSRSEMRRGTDMMKTLSKADRGWLESRGLYLPGFDNKIKISGEDVGLTQKEMNRYTELVKSGYEIAVQQVLRKVYDDLSSKERRELFSEVFSKAREAAREQLESELVSESEKDKKNRKFKALQ